MYESLYAYSGRRCVPFNRNVCWAVIMWDLWIFVWVVQVQLNYSENIKICSWFVTYTHIWIKQLFCWILTNKLLKSLLTDCANQVLHAKINTMIATTKSRVGRNEVNCLTLFCSFRTSHWDRNRSCCHLWKRGNQSKSMTFYLIFWIKNGLGIFNNWKKQRGTARNTETSKLKSL